MPATLISNQSSADAQSITFSSIPTSYNHLKLFVHVSARDNSSGNNNLVVRVNGITTSTYGWVAGRSYNGSTSAGTTTPTRVSDRAASSSWLTLSGSNNTATPGGSMCVLDFADYNGTSNSKNFLYYYSNPRNAGGTYQSNSDYIWGMGALQSAAAITSIQVLSTTRQGLLWRASLWGY